MTDSVAVLSSGGLDSCVLLADMAQAAPVYPIYIQNGLVWEKEELKALQTFIAALNHRNIQPITTLSLPLRALYENHWSVTKSDIPTQDDPDSKTYIPGRNVLLLGLAAVWCSLHEIKRIAIGALRGNPFPDATPDFFDTFSKTVSIGLAFPIKIEAPYREKYKKEDLIRKHQDLPLALSMTCMAPKNGKHCGQCNKCYERQVGYKAAGVVDPTNYVKKQKRA